MTIKTDSFTDKFSDDFAPHPKRVISGAPAARQEEPRLGADVS